MVFRKLGKRLEGLEIRGRIDTIQTTELLRYTIYLEASWRPEKICCLSGWSEKLSVKADGKKLPRSKIIIMIMIIIIIVIIQRGIFQEDALSQSLFVVAMVPLHHILRECMIENKFTKSQEKINHLRYMDDIKLFAKKKKKWKITWDSDTNNKNIQSGM